MFYNTRISKLENRVTYLEKMVEWLLRPREGSNISLVKPTKKLKVTDPKPRGRKVGMKFPHGYGKKECTVCGKRVKYMWSHVNYNHKENAPNPF